MVNKSFENDELIIMYEDENGYYLDKREGKFYKINFFYGFDYKDELNCLIGLNFSVDTYKELKDMYLYESNLEDEDGRYVMAMLDFKIIILENNYKYYEIVEDVYYDNDRLLLIVYEDEKHNIEFTHYERELEEFGGFVRVYEITINDCFMDVYDSKDEAIKIAKSMKDEDVIVSEYLKSYDWFKKVFVKHECIDIEFSECEFVGIVYDSKEGV